MSSFSLVSSLEEDWWPLLDILVLDRLSRTSFPDRDPVVDLVGDGDLGLEVIYSYSVIPYKGSQSVINRSARGASPR